VVWFGEPLDRSVLERAFALAEEADVCLVAGTSAVVQPAASLPLIARRRGGRVIEVNPDPTPLSAVAVPFCGGRPFERAAQNRIRSRRASPGRAKE
jgi:NAD-dependent deacetylase